MQEDKCEDIVPAHRLPKVIGSYLKSDASSIKTAKLMGVEFDRAKLKEWLVHECVRRTGADASIAQEAVEEKLAEDTVAEDTVGTADYYDDDWDFDDCDYSDDDD